MSTITAAPADITLGGQVLRLAPLSDQDIEELDNWVRARVIQTARQATHGMSAADAAATMDDAFRHAMKLTWLRDGVECLATLDGIARVLWQCLRKHQPSLTYEAVQGMVTGNQTDPAVLDVFDLLNADPQKKSP